MRICYYCERKISDLPYRCKFCGMIFCKNHRLPENHICPFDLRGKTAYTEDSIIYQDALEFMGKKLTVGKIYDYVTTNQMNKAEATDLLTYFIENSTDDEIRKVSILAFKILELTSEKAFSILESNLLSEENTDVKELMIKVLTTNFPSKSKKLLTWIKESEKS
ncbi:MAG TPA: hypothetical protein ENH75_03545 [archaeon]|nr:hypothetical protein [archaeon]